MSGATRVLLAAGIVIVDVVTVGLPLAAIFAAYVLVARPRFFRAWVTRLYGC